jgi:hypothetical protein
VAHEGYRSPKARCAQAEEVAGKAASGRSASGLGHWTFNVTTVTLATRWLPPGSSVPTGSRGSRLASGSRSGGVSSGLAL